LTIYLASHGGYLDPALRIAVVVRDREYETVVYRGRSPDLYFLSRRDQLIALAARRAPRAIPLPTTPGEFSCRATRHKVCEKNDYHKCDPLLRRFGLFL
jgi:hypothetical protein